MSGCEALPRQEARTYGLQGEYSMVKEQAALKAVNLNREEMRFIGVVGSGCWGKNLVRNYGELGALRLICDNNEITPSQFKGKYPDVEVCVAFNEVIRREDIQALVIVAKP
jgi:hypothetical protein